MRIFSASHLLDAVLLCFFGPQDNGKGRVPQEDRTSGQIPDVGFAVPIFWGPDLPCVKRRRRQRPRLLSRGCP